MMFGSKNKNLKSISYSTVLLLLSFALMFAIFKYGIPFVGLIYSLFLGKNPSEQFITDSQNIVPKPILYSTIEATNSANFYLEGKSFVDGKTIFYLNGTKIEEIESEKNLLFRIPVRLKNGENTLYAQSVNKNEFTSGPTEPLIITFDTTSPVLEISSPSTDTQFYGEKERNITIVGKTDENSSVYINDRQAVVDKGGNFDFNLILQEGENKIKVQAANIYGNSSETELIVFFQP